MLLSEHLAYRHFLRLVLQVAGRLDGPGPGGEPISQDSRQSADAQQRGGRQRVKEVAKLIHLRDPQAAHHLLGLYLLHQVGT